MRQVTPRFSSLRSSGWVSRLSGKLGRKPDPIGADPNRPVLSLNAGRAAVAALLDAPDHPIWERFR